jgi:CO dehydrogenase/acetyl-CoA synthase beta subunit
MELTDCAPLIKQILEMVRDQRRGFSRHLPDNGEETRRIGFLPKGEKAGRPVIVTADNAALELGSPQHPTVSTLLWTKQKELLSRTIWIAGRDFPQIKESPVSFAQVVMVELESDFDPTGPNIQTLSNLTNRIPGYMTRSIPGKVWIRIHRDLLSREFSLLSLGQCLTQAYHESIPGLRNIEVVLIAGNADLVGHLIPIHNRARVIYGENKKLALEADGTISCEDLDCENCAEKPACDTLRDVIVKRRKLS